MDTGYYVSNHTICTGRLDFSKGWNATYAGCSKVVPEFFYSLTYLLHGGWNNYKFYSRFYYSFYCFVVALLVGYVASALNKGFDLSFFIGFTIFCLLSSEPHYGIYFESGEQFELLPQVLGFLSIFLGVDSNIPWMIGVGVGLWVLDSYFVKLSSLPAAMILGLGAGYIAPSSISYSIAFSLLASAIYLWWIVYNGQSITKLLQPIIGHEVHFGHQLSVKTYLKRLFYKVGFLSSILLSHPLIPTVALIGFLSDYSKMSFLLLYLAAVSVSYVVQAAHVWYYTIPFLPVIALLATFGVQALLKEGWLGWTACSTLLFMWMIMHGWRAYGMDLEQLNRWTWLPYFRSKSNIPKRNMEVDQIVPLLRSIIGDDTLLILGPYSQIYVLLESSYPTSIVSVASWLDTMSPNWSNTFCESLLKHPPRFVIDTDSVLHNNRNGNEVISIIKCKYRLVPLWSSQLGLYALK